MYYIRPNATVLKLHPLWRTNSKATFFSLSRNSFRPGGYIDAIALVNQNKSKALATINQLSAIGVHPKGFSPLLGIRFYSHIVRARLEYGLAIAKITTFLSKQLEDAQNVCLRRIFGGSHVSSTTIMLHMSRLLTMQERAYALPSQFLLRSLTLPEDALLHHLLPLISQPKATPNGTSSIGLPFGRDAPPTQSPWIIALYGRYSGNIAKATSIINILPMSRSPYALSLNYLFQPCLMATYVQV
ncbi:hypothetical protein RMCBS344292_03381 [Rhizopus microsporus]|nr:hypothetical protein RMCBS344292_03381 [Rhizopus microsporus]